MRTSGVLLPIFSLPSPYGVGTLGKSAYEFADFLARAGQSFWQVLPTAPTGFGDSPYQSFSSFAGNPYFIDLDLLKKDKLLRGEELAGARTAGGRVDYAALYRTRFPLLRRAYERFILRLPPDFFEYCRKNDDWLSDYALFMAIKDARGGASFDVWEDGLKFRRPAAMRRAVKTLAHDVGFYKFLQYEFEKQWRALRAYANERGVRIIGDIPIYVSADSADVWANPKDFCLDRALRPKKVAGCPPDAFSADGQLWGNPIYDWRYQARHGFSFWCRRIARQAAFFDVLRIDHFRGFASYYAIPAGAATAATGQWEKGPGVTLFRAIARAVGDFPIIAEDLGCITPDVKKLLAACGYPGMKVLQFAFDPHTPSDYLPHRYETKNAVVYVGTHDNDTATGWMRSAPAEEVAYAVRYLGLNAKEGYAWGFMRGAAASACDTAIYTAQDLLSLDSRARLNTPSVAAGNWTWRLTALPGRQVERRLYRLTADFGRLPQGE
ncbi:MAG: 4-alpha-glucanotransferase [Clostridia bacterium]|nr:4-alpha-glucanotransferase [Clostridia bacterium]